MKLLIDGKNAFKEIKNQIINAKESILINMFIWRNDTIGNEIASLVLDALNRGVRVKISKDVYGNVCEYSEENKKSFFHKTLTFSEKIKVKYLDFKYNHDPKDIKKEIIEDDNTLYNKIINHENASIDIRFKADHSKYYIFDEKVVIFGGVNIEDKENGCDFIGRKYHDYMVYIDECDMVKEFLDYAYKGISTTHFVSNIKEPNNIWESRESYLNLIRNSKTELVIVMAYFSPLKDFVDEIVKASKRGVNVRIITSKNSNFQDDLNKKTLSLLRKKSNNKIKCYYYDGMLHAKMLISDSSISFGSCNITKKAFNQLNELNLFIERDESEFVKSVLNDAYDTIDNAYVIDGKIKYHKFNAFIESLMV